MKKILLIFTLFSFLFLSSADLTEGRLELTPEQIVKLELLREIRIFEKESGFRETKNFQYFSGEIESFDYCYYTSVTELPYSYNDPRLRIVRGKAGASLDPEKFDIFCYSMEAIAGAPQITASFLRSPLPRFIMVVFHEDWHEQFEFEITGGIGEPSAVLVGYLGALLFSEKKFGKNSKIYKSLERELRGSFGEVRVYSYYHQKLTDLYQAFDSGKISKEETFSRKADLLKSMAEELEVIWGVKIQALNNAYVAFQMTYLRHLPLMHKVWLASGCDFRGATAILKSAPIPIQRGLLKGKMEELQWLEKETIDYFLATLEELEKPEPEKEGRCITTPIF